MKTRAKKFRVWTNGKMFYSDDIGHFAIADLSNDFFDCVMDCFSISGVEFYEGDIVKNGIGIGIVKFEGASYFVDYVYDEPNPTLRANGCLYWGDVIGNIFENQDMILKYGLK